MKNQQSNIVAIDINAVNSRILEVRNQQVLLDRDVAALYGVETRIINQAVKNNPEKFPAGYVAELTAQEVEVLRSKILTLEAKPGKGPDDRRNRVVDGDQLPHWQAQAYRAQGQEGEQFPGDVNTRSIGMMSSST